MTSGSWGSSLLSPRATVGLSARVAWKALIDEPKRFVSMLVGVATAVVLVCFQTSLLIGFVRAAAVVPAHSDADLWMMPRAVPAFEYADLLEVAAGDRLRAHPAVRRLDPVIVSFARYVGPGGQRNAVVLIGLPREGLGDLPRTNSDDEYGVDQRLRFDSSSGTVLGWKNSGSRVEVNGRSFVLGELTLGYGSFLGSPYAFTDVHAARSVLGLSSDHAHYLAIDLEPGADPESVAHSLTPMLPEYEFLSSREFGQRTAKYWLVGTGAGGGFLIAALLGALVGGIFVAQVMFSYVREHADEYAALAAIGAPPYVVSTTVVMQGAYCGVIGGVIGAALSIPFVWINKVTLVPWVYLPWWLLPVVFVFGVVLATLTSLAAAGRARREDPARVFRT